MAKFLDIDEVFVAEGDLRSVATEDGEAFYPDLQVVAIVDDEYFAHPKIYPGGVGALADAEDFAEAIDDRAEINASIWVRVDEFGRRA